jgi:hypothetical protein
LRTGSGQHHEGRFDADRWSERGSALGPSTHELPVAVGHGLGASGVLLRRDGSARLLLVQGASEACLCAGYRPPEGASKGNGAQGPPAMRSCRPPVTWVASGLRSARRMAPRDASRQARPTALLRATSRMEHCSCAFHDTARSRKMRQVGDPVRGGWGDCSRNRLAGSLMRPGECRP